MHFLQIVNVILSLFDPLLQETIIELIALGLGLRLSWHRWPLLLNAKPRHFIHLRELDITLILLSPAQNIILTKLLWLSWWFLRFGGSEIKVVHVLLFW